MDKKLNMIKKFTIFGALGALVYVFHVVLGGILWNGYSHLIQPISDLTGTGAPNKDLLSIITFIYGLCSIVFTISVYLYLKGSVPKIARVGMLTFIAMHLVSITYGLFPVDLPGSSITFKGIMHIVVTGLIVPLTILSPLLIGIGLRKIESFKGFATYSIITGVIIFVAGGTTAIIFANKLPNFGLFERINIGTLQLWMLVFSLKLFRKDDKKSKTITSNIAV
ncbi:MAG: DUF998 domain-containing protein [Bacillota bacterium]